MRFRAAIQDDLPHLTAAWLMAFNWTGQARFTEFELRQDPYATRSIDGWKSATDEGVIAVDGELADSPVAGAIWMRLTTAQEPGYGHVADDVPELAGLAVWEPYRGLGVGNALVQRLLEKAQSNGWRALSLSVEDGNVTARALYARHGFDVVGRQGNSDTMLLTF